MTPSEQLVKLIQREKNFRVIRDRNAKFFLTHEGKTMLDEWINDVYIFSQRYLQSHPLYQRIHTVIFHRDKDTISALMACLHSIEKDDEFWSMNGDDNDMEEFEKLLQTILEKINHNDPTVMSYLKKPYGMPVFRKLQDEGLIAHLQTVGRDYVGFIVTYDGLHYFERKEKQNVKRIPANKQYDLFLSHANQDKQDYVDELKKSLDRLDISIFYDKDTLKWGNRWKEKILDGVQKAEFAIIVISENFFGREWTERELNELMTRQNNSGQEIILPILHNITREQLEEKYPELAGIQYINSQGRSMDEIAVLFAERLIHRLKAQETTNE